MVFNIRTPTWTDGALDQYLELHLLPEQPDRLDVIAFLREAAKQRSRGATFRAPRMGTQLPPLR